MGRRTRVGWLALALCAALGVSSGVPGQAAGVSSGVPGHRAGAEAPRAVHAEQTFGDPAVAKTKGGYVAVATGALVRRAWSRNGTTWKTIEPALERLPTWAARKRGDIWAPEIAKVKGRWVLYFSVPVKGLTRTGRCIGVATSKTPTGTFTPDDRGPLVCPARGRTPAAGNQLPDAVGLPRHGVIDPSLHIDATGRPILIYKTDGIPSTLRTLPLRHHGRAPQKGAVSREVLRSTGVIENPVLVHRKSGLYLFTSEGSYAHCTYATTWRRGTTLDDLATAAPAVLTDRATTGLCGPAGADVLTVKKRTHLYLHAWACKRGTKPCGKRFTIADTRHKRAVRAMYAVRLRFVAGIPTLGAWRD